MSTSARFVSALAIAAAVAGVAPTVRAADAKLDVRIDGVDARGRLPDSAAFCPPQGTAAKDVSPGVSWSAGPTGTRSYAVLMTDPDVPEDFGLINKPGVTIPADAPRISVFHWVLADVPAALTSLAPGAESDGLTPGGKPIGQTPHGLRGANVYTTFLAKVDGMAGTYGGYDGPCPPVNDARVHSYVVRVFALDVETLGLKGAFDGRAVETAMTGHVIASGRAVATYALNPGLDDKAATK